MSEVNKGQMSGNGSREKFAEPRNVVTPSVSVGGGSSSLGEKTGFISSGYIDKKGTPYGEAAKLNLMPPGMDITNQEMFDDVNLGSIKTVVSGSYPGDGW